jgi:hypothetical protein
MDYYDALEDGYNCRGAGGHSLMSQASRERMSRSRTGVRFTEERKRRISEGLRGVRKSAAHRQRLSEIQRGRPRRPHTDKAKHKISNALRNKRRLPQS